MVMLIDIEERRAPKMGKMGVKCEDIHIHIFSHNSIKYK